MPNNADNLDGNRPAPRARHVSGLRRAILLLGAGAFFMLGVAGAILPGIPATPFLLLTSYFLVRSSPKLNEALLRSRWFGPLLTDWQVHGGVRPAAKMKAVLLVSGCVALTAFLAGRSWPWTAGVAVLALVGIVVILRLPNAKPVDGVPGND